MNKVILWDFDNTLAYREGMWRSALSQATEVLYPNNTFTGNEIKVYLGNGFPWHTPEQPWLDEVTPDKWWRRIFTVFEKAYCSLGYNQEQSFQLARKAKEIYLSEDSFKLFDDTVEVLKTLNQKGFSHSILSNHVPELENIVQNLKIDEYFDNIFSSANIGYSKPHTKIYEFALNKLNAEPNDCCMVGDNEIADVYGPTKLGIKSILVRKDPKNKTTKLYSKDLKGVLELL